MKFCKIVDVFLFTPEALDDPDTWPLWVMQCFPGGVEHYNDDGEPSLTDNVKDLKPGSLAVRDGDTCYIVHAGFASIFYENYSSLNVLLNNERIKDIEILKAAINSIKDRGKLFIGSEK